MLEHYSLLLLVWAFTYFIHSSILIATAFLIDHAGLLKKTRNAELVWRFALFGALITASAQLSLNITTGSSNTNKNVNSSQLGDLKLRPQSPTTLQSLNYPLPEQLSTENQTTLASQNSVVNHGRLNTPDEFNAKPLEISLPLRVRSTATYFVFAWLMIAVAGCFATYRSARYLNRLAAFFPDADKTTLKRLLRRVDDQQQDRIQLKISEQWNSPFVTPDNTICIPKWAYTNLNDDQRDAMLAHELAHVLRHDPAWRLAMQTLSRLCFFQPLHGVAIQKLELLAELACDQQAALASGKPHELAEALYACAQMTKTNHIPDLALAMSRDGSPLLKRITSLLDQDFAGKSISTQTRSARFFHLGTPVVGLLIIIFITPSFMISFDKGIPSLQEVASNVKAFAREVHQQAITSRGDWTPKEPAISSLLAVAHVPSEVTKTYDDTNNSSSIKHDIELNEANIVDTYKSLEKTDRKDPQNSNLIDRALAGDVDAQLALADAYWRGLSVATDVTQAGIWFKRAALNGSKLAETQLILLQEREQHLNEIAFYTEHYDAAEWNFADMKCVRPDFSVVAQNTVDIENMISQVNEFANCFNRYGEKLNASKLHERVMPHAIIRLMTDAEIEKALNRNTRAMASIRLTASLIAEEFMVDKRNWEKRTREQFNGARSRDWLSLKRIAIGNESEAIQSISQQTSLVKIQTTAELLTNTQSFIH